MSKDLINGLCVEIFERLPKDMDLIDLAILASAFGIALRIVEFRHSI